MNPLVVTVPLSTPLPGAVGPIIALRLSPVNPSYRKRRPRDVEATLWMLSQYTGVHHSILKHLSEPDAAAVVSSFGELSARLDRTAAMLDGSGGER
jgi:hypothetical protein